MAEARSVGKRYVYCWADGIHLEARLEEQAQCILVIIGATPSLNQKMANTQNVGCSQLQGSWPTACVGSVLIIQ